MVKLWLQHGDCLHRASIPDDCLYISDLIDHICRDVRDRSQLGIPEDCGTVSLLPHTGAASFNAGLTIQELTSSGFTNDSDHPILVRIRTSRQVSAIDLLEQGTRILR